MTTVGNDPSVGGSLTETFVVRLWGAPQQADGNQPAGLRGVVRHARSGRSATFAEEAALLAFLRAIRDGEERQPARAS